MEKPFTTEGTERTEKTLLKHVFLSGAARSVKTCSSCISEEAARESNAARTASLLDKVFSVLSVYSVAKAFSRPARDFGVQHQEQPSCS